MIWLLLSLITPASSLAYGWLLLISDECHVVVCHFSSFRERAEGNFAVLHKSCICNSQGRLRSQASFYLGLKATEKKINTGAIYSVNISTQSDNNNNTTDVSIKKMVTWQLLWHPLIFTSGDLQYSFDVICTMIDMFVIRWNTWMVLWYQTNFFNQHY